MSHYLFYLTQLISSFLLFYRFSFSLTANTRTHSLMDEKQNFIVVKMPALNKPAPQFAGTAVVNGEFKEISLDQYKGKYVVLFFYPLDL